MLEPKERRITLPELALIAVTRVALGVGIGLLLSEKFDLKERKAVGATLVALGAISTVPLAINVLGKSG